MDNKPNAGNIPYNSSNEAPLRINPRWHIYDRKPNHIRTIPRTPKMAHLTRHKGMTTIEFNNLKIKSKNINKYRYNDLRKKKDTLKLYDIEKIIGKGL